MEFFEFADIATTEEGIRTVFAIEALPELCDEIESVDMEESLGRVIYFSRWGRFQQDLWPQPACGQSFVCQL